MIKRLLSVAIAIISSTLFAAAGISLTPGGWQTVFSYHDISQIEMSSRNIYALSTGGIFYFDKAYNSVHTIDYNDGITPGVIQSIAYVESIQSLFIIHTDLTIDIWKDGQTFTDFSIRDKAIPNKSVSSIIACGQYVFINAGFGIVKYNVMKREVADTYIIGNEGNYLSVLGSVVEGDSIYALTATDVRRAKVSSPSLSNFNQWDSIPLPNDKHKTITSYRGRIILGTEAGAFALNGNDEWDNITPAESKMMPRVKTYLGVLTMSNDDHMYAFAGDSLMPSYTFDSWSSDAVYDIESTRFWFAGGSLCYVSPEGEIGYLFPWQMSLNCFSSLTVDSGDLILCSGGGWGVNGVTDVLQNDEWNTITITNQGKEYDFHKYFKNVRKAIFDKADRRRIYVATWRGVYEFYDYTLCGHYGYENSTLIPHTGAADSMLTLCENIWQDDKGNLFVTNTQANYLIHVRDKNGKWTALRHNEIAKTNYANHHIFTSSGIEVIPISSAGAGVIFVDMNGTPTDDTDDKVRRFTTFTYSNGSSQEIFTPERVPAVAEDHNGNLWIGTDQGPFILEKMKNVFTTGNKVTRPKITRDDDSRYADYLLASDLITSIVVDGKNRKWLGTEANGLYLVSENGDEIVKHFTTDNSPLPSNEITELALDGRTGYLYALTSFGLAVYSTDTSESREDNDSIIVYPNPVRPEYTGDIEIQGLAEDSNVRITDTKGNVVINGMSNGGTYRWNGRRDSGERVASGVYFIFATTADGQTYGRAKVAIVR